MTMETKRKLCRQVFVIVLILATVFITTGAKAASAEEQKLPYLIKVNRYHNTITVYEPDEKGAYTLPVRAMICSVGVNGRTITGTFQTKAKYRWKALMGDVYGQYSTRIVGGILFHSVYYYENGNPATLATNEFNKLGSAASHGCIRLTVEDAKWIYDNCSVGTTVVIYDDKKEPGPLGKPESIKLPKSVRWDPTDPNTNNPFKDKNPLIYGAKSITVSLGEERDLLEGVKAKSTVGLDITSKLTVTGEVDYQIPGAYEITYKVSDTLGRIGEKTIIVTVSTEIAVPAMETEQAQDSSPKEESKPFDTDYNYEEAQLTGVKTKYIIAGIAPDRDFVLDGVDANCEGHILDQEYILVTIDIVNDSEYRVTYTIKSTTISKTAKVIVDGEAPVLKGISDRMMNSGEMLFKEAALDGVTVTDNYTKLTIEDIKVTINEVTEGDYQVVYEVRDAAGNITIEQALFHD